MTSDTKAPLPHFTGIAHSPSSPQDVAWADLVKDQFSDQKDIRYDLARFMLDISDNEFIERIIRITNTEFRTEIDVHNIILLSEHRAALIIHSDSPSSRDKRTRASRKVAITGIGREVNEIRKALEQEFAGELLPTVIWHYKTCKGMGTRPVVLAPQPRPHDILYPYIGEGVDNFINAYLASPASLMLLHGPAGTGKTTFIRHMVCNHTKSATITYDEELLASDEIFVDFLSQPDQGVLVIEDADTMLASRENEANKLTARFLNISDGLMKLNNKKIIFTTNLDSFQDVDKALLRPGRCFAALNFRPLSLEEANAAARTLGLPLPPQNVPQLTLAELFAEQARRDIQPRAVGFTN